MLGVAIPVLAGDLGVTTILLGVGKRVANRGPNWGPWILSGVCLLEFSWGLINQLLGYVRCVMFAWVLDRILLGDVFLRRLLGDVVFRVLFAWGR